MQPPTFTQIPHPFIANPTILYLDHNLPKISILKLLMPALLNNWMPLAPILL